ncbi:hypothetical protein K3495_g16400 [Podosphaera aphanis]|nr:hypothetical protein K3495_g16400 [Podosphaera aphanis]
MESSKFCTNCGCLRPSEEFRTNQQGIPLQTCSRHTRLKRKQPSITSWIEFLFQIKDWNRPSQNNQFNTSYIFDMDELPVSFGPQPERSTDGTFEKADLDRAMEILIEIVWQNSGFRSPKVIYQECATEI